MTKALFCGRLAEFDEAVMFNAKGIHGKGDAILPFGSGSKKKNKE